MTVSKLKTLKMTISVVKEMLKVEKREKIMEQGS